MTSSHSVTGRSSGSWLSVQGLIGWRKARSHASTMPLSECVAVSDQGCSLRVIHVRVGEGIARFVDSDSVFFVPIDSGSHLLGEEYRNIGIYWEMLQEFISTCPLCTAVTVPWLCCLMSAGNLDFPLRNAGCDSGYVYFVTFHLVPGSHLFGAVCC